MARRSFQVKDEQRATVKTLSAHGCRHEDIAKLLEIPLKTLRQRFKSELELGAIESSSQVLESLFKMATSGKSTSASIFWAKTRCGWREKSTEESPSQEPFITPAILFSGDEE